MLTLSQVLVLRKCIGAAAGAKQKRTQKALHSPAPSAGAHRFGRRLVEVIPVQKINEAYERMLKGDVKYRFVIDIASLR